MNKAEKPLKCRVCCICLCCTTNGEQSFARDVICLCLPTALVSPGAPSVEAV